MQRSLIFVISLCWVFGCAGQLGTLRGLDDRLISGDGSAFVELAAYLDSPRVIIDHLGYHRIPTPIRWIARRIIRENCLFLDSELEIDSSLTKTRFLRFLDSNRPRLIFDDTTREFLLTPLANRSTPFELREMSEEEIREIDSTVDLREFPAWVYKNGIIKPVLDKDPLALLWIASAYYENRARFDRYLFNQQEFVDLMKRLTHVVVGVPDESGATTFQLGANYDFGGIGRLNYLIFWESHFRDYRWDSQKNIFVNTKAAGRNENRAELFFKQMQSENDSIALRAFEAISSLDTAEIDHLLDEYSRYGVDLNSSLPIFSYKFMLVIRRLVNYCQKNNLGYEPKGWVKARLDRLLDQKLSFGARYACEDSMIDLIRPDEVTQVEYFGLIHEESWEATYSIGRILDKWYSRNLAALIQDRQSLALYLKKDSIFLDLGIIGMCNKYGKKFENCSKPALAALGALAMKSPDPEVRADAAKLQKRYALPIIVTYHDEKVDVANSDRHIRRLKHNLYKALTTKKREKWEDNNYYEVSEVVGKIRYNQIGELLKLTRADTVLKKNVYNYLERDFGFPVDDDDTAELKEFEADYHELDEYELYRKYLRKVNPVYGSAIDRSDYKKLYDILKFDVVDAFVGGGGGRREDGVYMLIKLLELRFRTTLGFPRKFCNAVGVYGCDCTDRAKYWMQFLEQKGLVKPDRVEPVSVSHNY